MKADTVPKSAKRQQPKGGSRKGIPNKVTAELKAMILTALDAAGGVKYLTAQAHESPGAFLALLGKILPMQLAGDPEKPLVIDVSGATPDQLRALAALKLPNAGD